MDELFLKFYGWLRAQSLELVSGGGRETFEQGYRQGYQNATDDHLEMMKEMAWEEAGEELE